MTVADFFQPSVGHSFFLVGQPLAVEPATAAVLALSFSAEPSAPSMLRCRVRNAVTLAEVQVVETSLGSAVSESRVACRCAARHSARA